MEDCTLSRSSISPSIREVSIASSLKRSARSSAASAIAMPPNAPANFPAATRYRASSSGLCPDSHSKSGHSASCQFQSMIDTLLRYRS